VFYDRFIELCNRKGVAPTRAAIDAGISKSLVSKWKANESKEPSPEIVRKLAEYFGISKFEVLEDFPSQTEKAPTPTGERSISDGDLKFALFGEREIDDELFEQVKQFAKFAKEQRRQKSD
jgi:transcriptional regulator with XRE-family HTH domain